MASEATGSQISPEALASQSLDEVRAYVSNHDLNTVGTRPPFGAYVKDLWNRRGFIWTLSFAKYQARNEGQKFGQLWAVVNPLMMIGTYLFVFGFLLKANRSIDNYIGYLAIGIIVFGMTASTMTGGSRAILNNTGLVRALHFPRAVLPISTIITEFLEAAVGLGLMLLIVPFTGDLPHVKWLLVPFAMLIHAAVQTGIVLVLARIVNMSADVWNLIPVITRLLRYVSGVFFSVAAVTQHQPVLYHVLEYQPFALTLTLARQSMLHEFGLQWQMWLAGVIYAVVFPLVGLWIFWRDEAKYGRG